jgi:hypothetical protein
MPRQPRAAPPGQGPGRKPDARRKPRPLGFAVWINAQHDPRDLTPVGTLLIGVEHPHVRDQVFLVIHREGWSGWRYVGNIRIEWRRSHRHSRQECGAEGHHIICPG